MPFARPAITDLIDRIASDIETQLPGTDARLRRSNLNVLARVEAGVAHSLYGYLDWLARQLMPDTADVEHLDRWAAIWGVTRIAATYASGHLTLTGTDTTEIPTGTFWQRSDGQRYASTADAVIADGTATVAIQAETAGDSPNTDAGTSLTVSSPIAGLTSAATVATGGLTGGYDTESDTTLRARLLTRIQEPPQGGAAHDYLAWALAVAGITRAWCYPLQYGAGTVGVCVAADHDGIVPDAAKLAEVQAYIDARAPVTATVTVYAPILSPINVSVAVAPNTQAVREAITNSLAAMIFSRAEPGGIIRLSWFYEAIGIAAGESYCVLTAPTADVDQTAGYIATLGTITWGSLS